MSIVIVDSGGANIGSVKEALKRLDCPFLLSRNKEEIRAADKVLFPGVGASASAMDKINSYGIAETMRQLTQPVLGICLGMQLLFEHSAEGDTKCLGIIKGKVERIKVSKDTPLPHMGWNELEFLDETNPLLKDLEKGDQVYFVHTYAAPFSEETVAYSQYEATKVPAMVRRDNFYGCQFHPEKSASVGQKILRNFLEL